MDWAAFALLSAGLFGGVSMLDKFISASLVRDVRTYYLILGGLHVILGGLLLVVQPLPADVSGATIGIAAASGGSRGIGLALTLLVLRTEEVSRAIPVAHSYPIFVAILAVFLLNEALGPGEWVAILVTVGGIVLVSARRLPGRGGIVLGWPFLLLLLSSFAWAVSNILSKEALAEISSWNMLSFNSMFMGLLLLLLSARRPIVQEALTMVRRPRSFAWFLTNEFLALSAMLLMFASFALGPVSLASTLSATRPLFVFVYAVLSSWLVPRFLRESLSPGTLALKAVAIAMIIGGSSRLIIG